MKKICALILCALLVMSCITAFADGDCKINVKSQNVTDDGFDAVFSIENNPGIAAVTLIVNFDSDYLEVTGAEKLGIFSNENVLTTADSASGRTLSDLTSVNVTWYKLSNLTNDGDMFKISFKFKKDSKKQTAKVYVKNVKGSKKSSSVVNLDAATIEFTSNELSVEVPAGASKQETEGKETGDSTTDGSTGGGGLSSTPKAETKKAVKKSGISKIKYMSLDNKEKKFEPDRPATRYEVIEVLDALFDVDAKTLEKAYDDVDKNHANAVRKFITAGVLNGYEDKTFKGENTITRAELVKVLTIAFEVQEDKNVKTELTDIEGHWAENYIKAFVSKGFIVGYEDKTFRPNNKITRAELVALVNRMTNCSAEKSSNVPSDVSESHWAYNEIVKIIK